MKQGGLCGKGIFFFSCKLEVEALFELVYLDTEGTFMLERIREKF